MTNPDDNPYAAPQTPLHQSNNEIPIPLAQAAEYTRRDYPELSTEELNELERRSSEMGAGTFVAIISLIAIIPSYVLCEDLNPVFVLAAIFILLITINLERLRMLGTNKVLAICYFLGIPFALCNTIYSLCSQTGDWILTPLFVPVSLLILIYFLPTILLAAYSAWLTPQLFGKHKYDRHRLYVEKQYRQLYLIQ